MSRNRYATYMSLLGMLAIGLTANICVPAAPAQDDTKPTKHVQKSPETAQPKGDADHKPDADAVIERFIESTGGAKAIKAQSYRTVKGELSIASQGLNGTFVVHQAAPSYFLLEIDIPGFGTTRQGYNGEVAWSVDMMAGPRILDGEELETAKREGDFYSDINYKNHYPKRETVGKEDFSGAACWKLKLTTPNGAEYEAYYNLDTGLLAGIEGENVTAQGKIATVSHVEDYQEQDGIKFARKNTLDIPAFKLSQVFTIKSVSHEKFDKSMFDLPKEVKTLLEIKADEKKNADKDKKAGDDSRNDDASQEPKHEE